MADQEPRCLPIILATSGMCIEAGTAAHEPLIESVCSTSYTSDLRIVAHCRTNGAYQSADDDGAFQNQCCQICCM